MAKRPASRDTAPERRRSAAASSPRTRRTRSARRGRDGGLLERYGSLLVVGLAAAGVLLILFFLLQGSARAGYECGSLLTPGPEESVTPRPSPLSTPTAALTGSPSPATTVTATPAALPSPAATGAASPPVSPSPTAAASPAVSPTQDASPSPAGSPGASPTAAPEPTPRLGFTVPDLGAVHVSPNQTLNFPYCPPASGPHFAQPAGPLEPRVYPPTQEQSPGGWVHNLEHGHIVALYRCPSPDDCPSDAEMAALERFFNEAPQSEANPQCRKKVVVARFDALPTRFAVLAWGRVMLLDDFDVDRALTFAEQWIDHEAVPERGACP